MVPSSAHVEAAFVLSILELEILSFASMLKCSTRIRSRTDFFNQLHQLEKVKKVYTFHEMQQATETILSTVQTSVSMDFALAQYGYFAQCMAANAVQLLSPGFVA